MSRVRFFVNEYIDREPVDNRLKCVYVRNIDTVPRIGETVVLEEGNTGFRVDNVINRVTLNVVDVYLDYLDFKTNPRFVEIKG